MEKQTYSIDNIADQILKQGLIVFEDLSRLYIFEKPLA